jgi:DNA primase catalytic core
MARFSSVLAVLLLALALVSPLCVPPPQYNRGPPPSPSKPLNANFPNKPHMAAKPKAKLDLVHLKAAAPISKVIGHYVSSASRVAVISPSTSASAVQYKGTALCPFHSDTNPSMTFDDSRNNVWKCWSCGVGGDVFEFVRLIEGLGEGKKGFGAAVRIVSDIVGDEYNGTFTFNEVHASQSSAPMTATEKLYSINALARRYYTAALVSPASPQSSLARNHLKSLHVPPSLISRLNLGWSGAASSYSTDCIDYIRERYDGDLQDADFVTAGVSKYVTINNATTIADKFRNRLMIPISDASGNLTLAFSGRYLSRESSVDANSSSMNATFKPPKYLNSPTTPIFQKRNVIYDPLLSAQQFTKVVVVEGYFDVIALLSIGVPKTVATMGTAVSFEQLREIAELLHPRGASSSGAPGTSEIIFAYDSDAAGINAVLRVVEATDYLQRLAEQFPAVTVKVSSLASLRREDGGVVVDKDPGDFVQRLRSAAIPDPEIKKIYETEVLSTALDAAAWYARQLAETKAASMGSEASLSSSYSAALPSVITKLTSFISTFPDHAPIRNRMVKSSAAALSATVAKGSGDSSTLSRRIEAAVIRKLAESTRAVNKAKLDTKKRSGKDGIKQWGVVNRLSSGDSSSRDALEIPSNATRRPLLKAQKAPPPPPPQRLSSSQRPYPSPGGFVPQETPELDPKFTSNPAMLITQDGQASILSSEERLLRALIRSSYTRASMKAAVSSFFASSTPDTPPIAWSSDDRRWLFNNLIGFEGIDALPVAIEEGPASLILDYLRGKEDRENGWLVASREDGSLDALFSELPDSSKKDSRLSKTDASLVAQETLAVLLRSKAIAHRDAIAHSLRDAVARSADPEALLKLEAELEEVLWAVKSLDDSYKSLLNRGRESAVS